VALRSGTASVGFGLADHVLPSSETCGIGHWVLRVTFICGEGADFGGITLRKVRPQPSL